MWLGGRMQGGAEACVVGEGMMLGLAGEPRHITGRRCSVRRWLGSALLERAGCCALGVATEFGFARESSGRSFSFSSSSIAAAGSGKASRAMPPSLTLRMAAKPGSVRLLERLAIGIDECSEQLRLNT